MHIKFNDSDVTQWYAFKSCTIIKNSEKNIFVTASGNNKIHPNENIVV